MIKTSYVLWGCLWRSYNGYDGHTTHLLFENNTPAIFRSRSQARAHIDKKYGYLRERKDLQVEPHGWKMPRAVRVYMEVKL